MGPDPNSIPLSGPFSPIGTAVQAPECQVVVAWAFGAHFARSPAVHPPFTQAQLGSDAQSDPDFAIWKHTARHVAT